jgi:UDP-N-acetylglucosamine:LPS N-acetylglucosamine transferase
LESLGVAVRADDSRQIPRLVHSLLGDPERLKEMSRRGRDMARPDAAHAVAQVGRALLDRGTYIDLLATAQSRPGESAYLM